MTARCRPFLVLATQNPMEFEGTFPLPEAQLDRFLGRAPLGYPAPEEELAMLRALEGAHPIGSVRAGGGRRGAAGAAARGVGVHVDDTLREYLVRLANATRQHPDLALGASRAPATRCSAEPRPRRAGRARLCHPR